MALHEKAHLIAVIGGKGGVGKSVFAANFALTLMREMNQRVLLIDADARSAGDQNVIVGLRPQKTLPDLANFNGTITQQSIQSLVTTHKAGLGFIGAVQGPDQNLRASPEVIRKHLYSISQFYPYIVVDLGTELEDLQMGLLEEASLGMIVTTPDILVVNQSRRILKELYDATFPADLFHVVVNKAGSGGTNASAISQSLRRPVIGQVPNDEKLTSMALNQKMPFVLTQPNSPVSGSYREIARKMTGGVLQKLKALQKPSQSKSLRQKDSASLSGKTSQGVFKGGGKNQDPETLLKMQIHAELIKEMDLQEDLQNSQDDPEKQEELRNKTRRTIAMLFDRMAQGYGKEDRTRIIKHVLDESLGLGVLEELLEDPTVSEIMVNGHDKIFVEKSGRLTLSPVSFTSNQNLLNVIQRIVLPLGRQINKKTPLVDARLPDGSRVNAVIEPLAIDGPALTIRKFAKERITPDHYIGWNTLNKNMIDFLRICVEQGLNVIISGGTGSGKTTLLNVLSSFIPANERIVTVEDAAELQMLQEHVVRLETRPPNLEGTGEITIRDLIKNSLRMRPDRIVVGECRDGAALDMLAAMNTGHDGSMTTVHANNPNEALSRLETLCLMAGMELPLTAIREQIAGAVDLIIQIGRLSDGSRKVLSITEVVGMSGEVVTRQEVFRFKEEGTDKNRKIVGRFMATGHIPTFVKKFEQRGVKIPTNIFSNSDESQSGGVAKPTPARRPSMVKPVKKASGES
ncbi:MAG: pilus assembly protein TadA [Bdellovibrionaceae bacterium]|nr:pilus assembly protein TadA [Pseudobdellovibrionaceae bacterium]